jgi:hypothetical protein
VTAFLARHTFVRALLRNRTGGRVVRRSRRTVSVR